MCTIFQILCASLGTIRFWLLGYLPPALDSRCARSSCARDLERTVSDDIFSTVMEPTASCSRRKDWPRTCSGLMSAVNAQILFRNRAIVRFICGGKNIVNGQGASLCGSSRFIYGKVKHRLGRWGDRASLADKSARRSRPRSQTQHVRYRQVVMAGRCCTRRQQKQDLTAWR